MMGFCLVTDGRRKGHTGGGSSFIRARCMPLTDSASVMHAILASTL